MTTKTIYRFFFTLVPPRTCLGPDLLIMSDIRQFKHGKLAGYPGDVLNVMPSKFGWILIGCPCF